jgi:hypothetical protein
VINSTLLSAATARDSARTSCRKNSRSFSRSPSTVKLFSVEKRSCTTAFAAISPTLSVFCRIWLVGKEKESYECIRRFPTNDRSRSESTCVYRAVVARLLCPRSVCTSRRLAPRSLSRSVAAVCRRGCAEMIGTRARSHASLTRALKGLAEEEALKK